MNRSKQILPNWLYYALILAVVFTAGVVTALVVRTAEAMLQSPLNPLHSETLVDDDALAAVPPMITVSSAEMTALPAVTMPELPELADDERINVLVMGIDRRPGQPFISRTDTMMLLSIDPGAETASMLSIPRDLWVDIPGIGVNRVNTAFLNGARSGNSAEGAALAMETLRTNLGVPVDHYLLIDFQAVTNVIDSLGGVTVDVPYEIYDPTYPDHGTGYDPLYVPAGVQTMDGEMALKYMRTRHSDSDFGRARRQQQIIMALRSQAATLGFADLLLRAPTLYRQLEEGIFTDLTLDQLLVIASTASDIPTDHIRSEVLDYTYVESWTSPGGGSVLRLLPEKVQPLIAELYG
ncbi:MAG: LCP family protein [Anaerolineae bacterium]|nr:LCP family protein [Anaerolineae bacterium]MCO5205136.1 LCP family protein [Anaerolineae bacterium]